MSAPAICDAGMQKLHQRIAGALLGDPSRPVTHYKFFVVGSKLFQHSGTNLFLFRNNFLIVLVIQKICSETK